MALADSVEPTLDISGSAKSKYASRDDFLGASGNLAEEELDVDGIGTLVLSEITGADRAKIIGRSAQAMNDGQIDLGSYQGSLLLAGVVDPSSPKGARNPLLKEGDVGRIMKLGSAKVQDIVDVIERLSLMGRFTAGVEGNSVKTPSEGSTSA